MIGVDASQIERALITMSLSVKSLMTYVNRGDVEIPLLILLHQWLWHDSFVIGSVRSFSLLTKLLRYDNTVFSTLQMLL